MLLDRIPRMTLPALSFITLQKDDANKANKFSVKSSRTAFKTLLIAKDKNGNLKKSNSV